MSRMFSYTGRDNVNTTTIDNATDIGMPSSGSSGEAEVIWIILMLTVLLIVLPCKHYLHLRLNNIEELSNCNVDTLINIEVKNGCEYSETKRPTGLNSLPRIKDIDF